MERANLAAYGIQYEQGVARCAGDAGFYKLLLSMFLKDTTFSRAQEAYADGDDRALFAAVHELKGVSGTAALCDLYDAASLLVELLRSGQADETEKTRLFQDVAAAHRRAVEGIIQFTA